MSHKKKTLFGEGGLAERFGVDLADAFAVSSDLRTDVPVATVDVVEHLVRHLPHSRNELLALVESDTAVHFVVESLLEAATSAIADRRRMYSSAFDHLAYAADCIQLARQIEESAEWNAYYEAMSRIPLDRQIEALAARKGGPVTRVEVAALDALMYGFGGLSPERFRKQLALDVVLHKMLHHWAEADMAERRDVFFTNRLQLVDGSSKQAISRSTINKLIEEATERYCQGSRPSHQETVVEQVAARIAFDVRPWPLFWFRDQPYSNLFAKSASRRRRTSPELQPVHTWRCDVCDATYGAGSSDPVVMPERERVEIGRDKRLRNAPGGDTPRQALPIHALPTDAHVGDSYMCPCWRERAGILRPVFA